MPDTHTEIQTLPPPLQKQNKTPVSVSVYLSKQPMLRKPLTFSNPTLIPTVHYDIRKPKGISTPASDIYQVQNLNDDMKGYSSTPYKIFLFKTSSEHLAHYISSVHQLKLLMSAKSGNNSSYISIYPNDAHIFYP